MNPSEIILWHDSETNLSELERDGCLAQVMDTCAAAVAALTLRGAGTYKRIAAPELMTILSGKSSGGISLRDILPPELPRRSLHVLLVGEGYDQPRLQAVAAARHLLLARPQDVFAAIVMEDESLVAVTPAEFGYLIDRQIARDLELEEAAQGALSDDLPTLDMSLVDIDDL